MEERDAKEWIAVVEGERGRVREQDIYPRLKTWVDRVSPVDILDLGCGQGICSEKIDLANRRYTGVEPSRFLLERAKTLYPTRTFVEGNAHALPFSDDVFDAVFSIVVWHLLIDDKKAAKELGRVLRPGGNFLLITSHPDSYPEWADYHAKSGSTEKLYLRPLPNMLDSLKSAGLTIEKNEKFRDRFLSLEGHKDTGR